VQFAACCKKINTYNILIRQRYFAVCSKAREIVLLQGILATSKKRGMVIFPKKNVGVSYLSILEVTKLFFSARFGFQDGLCGNTVELSG
jgi:hypothetical protein